MPQKPKTPVQPTGYPYPIAPIAYLKNKALKHPNTPAVLEFFRIEALLRSEKVIEKYKTLTAKKDMKESEVAPQCGLPGDGAWYGVHHAYLLEKDPIMLANVGDQPNDQYGIHDLQVDLLEAHLLKGYGGSKWNLEYQMRQKDSPFLWVRLDSRHGPNTIWKKLEELLEKKRKQRSTESDTYPKAKPLQSPIQDIKAWIDYFRCYDLLHGDGKSYKEIAFEVYKDAPIQRKTDHVQKAVKRVSTLIQKAESNNWPPPSGFLKKS